MNRIPRFVYEVASYIKRRNNESMASEESKKAYSEYVNKYVQACERGLITPCECVNVLTSETGREF